ncbi:hypothetical protein K505DRAFT_369956 [Melanomma pulvis-pyrius CBS 109.77]|uniref:VOC domain-containing protein n=1 Tax=Melanomma pulvis-pyrius CBS 109.77 TaxID=1314802 RepID=A0A6A6XWX9_9PLEO|nr:hypothetical protein K505DRAFT_369956 [Melanomma pulvis-pyrius CBS 109.77]
MPVSHIGLTVSHLPTSCSFFLSALQPLGYRFIGEQGNQIGLGITDADFFLCQETPGVKAGAAHIAFTAPSRSAVRDFYAAALNAGGRPNGAPAARNDDTDHFNAAILDFDGNSIEVVFRNEPDVRIDGTVIEHSRVITWQRSVAETYRDDRSVASARTSQSASRQTVAPASAVGLTKAPSVVSKAPSKAPSVASMASTMIRSVSAPVSVPQVTVTSTSSGDGAAKTLIGTLLGAAAGAAVAYAMCKSEQDSAKKEREFIAFQEAKAQPVAQAIEQPKLSMQDPQLIYEAPPKSIHRNISDTESHYSTPQSRSAYVQRAIEPAPRSYYSPAYTSVAPTRVPEQMQIEYIPAHSVAPSRSHFTAPRSFTSPELTTVSKAKSTVSRVPSHAPSSLISSFVPDQPSRRSSEGSVHSHYSSKSKAKSSHSHVSKHSSHSKHSSKSRSRAPSPPPASTKAQSVIGSILGRDAKSNVSRKDDDVDDDFIEDFDFDEEYCDTVAPSDSISNAGSSSRRSHRSHKSSSKSRSGGSEVSRHSSSSKHSSKSKHSHHTSSKRSHHGESSPLREEWKDVEEHASRSNVISEPSDASTVRPIKSKSGRKDSMMAGQYDNLFSGNAQYGTGSVAATLPIRGITPSMVAETKDAKQGNGHRSMINYALGQKMRAFET